MNTNQNLNIDFLQDFFENFDLRFLLYVAKKSIFFIVTLLIFSFVIPFIYLRYTTPIFETRATLIKKKQNTNSLLEGKGADLFKSSEEDKLNRDIQVIKSDFLINNIIDSLNLRVQYFKKGRMFYKRFELNPGDYFSVGGEYEIFNKSLLNSEIEVDFNDQNSFNLTYKSNGSSFNINNLKTNRLYVNDNLKIKITNVNPSAEGTYVIVFHSDEYIRKYMLSNIEVTNNNPNIFFSIKSTNPTKSEFLLNKLITNFLKIDQQENTERLENSINYIKSYLDTMNGQVKSSQQEKINFLRSTNMYDPNIELESNVKDIESFKRNIEEGEIKLGMLERIQRQINLNSILSIELAPINEDKELVSLIKERNKLLADYKVSHPTIVLLDNQIKERVKIAQSAVNFKIDELKQQLSSMRGKQNQTISRATKIPEKGMELSKIQKELEIKEKYVIDLIEKQIQYLIAKSSIGSDYLLIQPPTTMENQVYPRRTLAYISSFMVCFFLCFIIIILRYVLFNKIISINEIKRNTNVPIIGQVPFIENVEDNEFKNKNSTISKLVVLSSFKSRESEVFKKMRASLKYTSAGSYKTICSTSTIPGEGKTFVLINLAAVHALLDKKVLLIDLDLRKPRISKSFKLPNTKGMSNLLSDKNTLLEDCIQRGVEIENLDVITSGPIPPNPSELITSKRFEEILEELKKKYDYIFVDTPPIGLVNESIEIVNKLDISLYLVKMNYSHKDCFNLLNETNRLKKHTNLFLVINHCDDGPSKYVNSKYGYGGDYTYGRYNFDSEDLGYYTESVKMKKTKLLKRIINFFDWKL